MNSPYNRNDGNPRGNGATGTDAKNSPASRSSLIQAPSVSLPTGGGAIKSIGETFQPNAFTGTASYSIKFPVTPARGFEPQVSIDYNSANGNSEFGIGFSLSLPGISVRTELGIPKYDGNDIFMMDGGELVLKNNIQTAIDGWKVKEYFPRVQAAFSLIRQFIKDDGTESYWSITTYENVVSVYGQTNESRIYNPTNPAQIAEWLINQSTDAKGNKIVYKYKAENTDNVPAEPWEQNRCYNNKYIQSICYGNYTDNSGKEQFAYHLIFDYGEHVLPSPTPHVGAFINPHEPVNKWNYRSDAFSSYTTGFEIRTCRLCSNILLFHFFEDKVGDICLARNIHLEYQSSLCYNNPNNPGLTLMSKAALSGYRRAGQTATDPYDVLPGPPIQFIFSEFHPPKDPVFKKLAINHNGIPGYLNTSAFQLLDLNGEGIGGLLYQDEDTIFYCSPEGDGEYERGLLPTHFPVDQNFSDGTVAFTDLNGDGVADLVVSDTERNGYYLKDFDKGWQPFTAFTSFPTNISDPSIELAGINNNGKTDAILVGNTHITLYPSLGTAGYDSPIVKEKQRDFPLVKKDYLQEYVGFADMIGDGLSHRIKITNDSVECWPDKGYGLFGKKITMGNAPLFGDQFDITRMFLTDLDGSGTTDIIYVDQNKINVYINQSGNYFSDPITIDLPEPYSVADQISFTDIKGNGTNCLVYTAAGPVMQHYYYDFTGEMIVDGKPEKSLKPYLLTEIDNNLGVVNRIRYCSSTKSYLEDKKSGNPWCTRLPFPVQIIEKLSVIDKINKACYTSRYKFHDGFYDAMERQFVGFGYVETWDTEDYASININPEYATVKEENYVPPVYTRTWYRTGAEFNHPFVISNYKAHFYKGDPGDYDFPDYVFDATIKQQDPETQRQAFVALKGQIIRTEVYGDDKDINPSLYQNPYTVTEANAKVCLFQERGNQPYAVFLIVPRENIAYNYERHPADPRVQQAFTLQTDSFGNAIESCLVFLQRRPEVSPDFISYPEQIKVRGNLSYQRYVTPLQNFLFFNIICEEQNFELNGIQPDIKWYFSFEGIQKQVATIGLPDRSKIIPYYGEFSSGVQARQISWNREYFWDWANPDKAPLPGSISSPALMHHAEEAVFTKEFTIDVFADRIINEAAYKNNGYLSNIIYTYGGYFYDPANQYWWNKGLVQYYYPNPVTPGSPPHFFQPFKTENSFAAGGQDSSLVKSTSVIYDEYWLFAVNLTQEIDSGTSNTILSAIDYIAAQPMQLTDINNNITQVLFDPLGQVIVSSTIGHENDLATGGMTLYANGQVKAQYADPGKASFHDVINNPEKYLQGACTYFYYNLNAWMDSQQPLCSINLIRNTYWQSANPAPGPYCQVLINYTDGLGRDIEKKLRAGINDNGPDNVVYEKWQVTGRTVYNNKGMPCEQYQPVFSAIPEYEGQQDLPGPPPAIIHYDSLLRVTKTDTPKRFFSKIEFTAWEEKHFDEDDTILDSWFYQHEYPGTLTPDEINAIDKAVKFYNTPSITVLDNKGDPFLEIKNNLGNILQDAFQSLENNGITSIGIWNDLLAKGYITPYLVLPLFDLHFLAAKFQPYVKGFVLQLDPKYSGILQAITDILKENCLTSYYTTDISGRVTESIDPRLYYSNIVHNTTYYNFKNIYAMGSGDPVVIDSVDAGMENPLMGSSAEKHLPNIFSSQLWTWTPRSYCQLFHYDRLQRKTKLYVKKITAPGIVQDYTDFNLVEIFVYGESCKYPEPYNLRGQLYQVNDLSGVVVNSSYSMRAQLLMSSRKMLAYYKTAVDWKGITPLFDSTVYPTSLCYNAVGQLLNQSTPDGSITTNTYNEAAQLQTVSVKFPDSSPPQNIIEHIEYNASNQRLVLRYGNGIVTKYNYEDTTLRLIGLKSRRPVNGNENTDLQDIEYYYDPAGNITRTLDKSVEVVFCKNQRVDPLADYTYNALYQLVIATGRQHTGITATTYQNNTADGFKQCFFGPPPFIADSDKLENYKEYYSYDDSGNLINIKHTASVTTSWPRPMPVEDNSNRLKNHVYDASGNLRQLDIANNADLSFNCCENLVRAGIIKRINEMDDCDYYMYDSDDQRTRKVSERIAENGTLTKVEDKIYIGNYEVKRNISVASNGNSSLIKERQTLKVMDGEHCIAIIYYAASDKSHKDMEGLRQCRFQLCNNIGSVCMEMSAGAELISYEEYFPYGGTSIITGISQAEVNEKEYRYSGKECDDMTGLYYYGARYYVSWQGRWLNPDPAGAIDGMDLFAFVGGNPVSLWDENGLSKKGKSAPPPKKKTPFFAKRDADELEEFESVDYEDDPMDVVATVGVDNPRERHSSMEQTPSKRKRNALQLKTDADRILGKMDKRTTVVTFEAKDSEGLFRSFVSTNTELPVPQIRERADELGYAPIRGVKTHAESNKMLYLLKHQKDLQYSGHGCDKAMCRMCEGIEKEMLGEDVVDFDGQFTEKFTGTYYHDYPGDSEGVKRMRATVELAYEAEGKRKKKIKAKTDVKGLGSFDKSPWQ